MAEKNLTYIQGFGAYACTEALPNALPANQNSPQVCPYGLYAEQLSGSAFTAPRAKNLRAWLYRIRPGVGHSPYEESHDQTLFQDFSNLVIEPGQLRWDPCPLPESTESVDFVQGLQIICGAGDIAVKEGLCIYNYSANAPMVNKAFYNSDGDFLIVPQMGTLYITTEMGRLNVSPSEIAVIPRGIRFSVFMDEQCRGYIVETYKGHFELPGLGPIGANGLANPRDFQVPVAWFEDREVPEGYTIVNKFVGKMFQCTTDHSPFDIVAWHGNYAPCKYDLKLFNVMNTVTYDHPDPSIYTVLTCQTDEPGTAVCDFVVFAPRWMVADHTFRPPYFHRNCMSEFMGMIHGVYDAKAAGFVPGGASLHSCMTCHGPDTATFLKASQEELKPAYFDGGLAFMFESNYMLKLNPKTLSSPQRQMSYTSCWRSMPKLFNGTMNPSFPTVEEAHAATANK